MTGHIVSYRIATIIGFCILILLGTFFVAAQSNSVEVSDAVCSPALDTLWTQASNACVGGPVGYICNGGSAPQAEPAGPVSNSLASPGALVDVGVKVGVSLGPK